VKLDGVHELARKRKFIRLVVKKRVFRNVYLVVVHIRAQLGKPNRLAIRNKMYFVAPSRELKAQFCSHDSRTSECRVTDYCYFHDGCIVGRSYEIRLKINGLATGLLLDDRLLYRFLHILSYVLFRKRIDRAIWE